MPRLRPVKSVRALTFEEQTRVANLFMLFIEIETQKGVTRKRRSPTSAKAKAKEKAKATKGESQIAEQESIKQEFFKQKLIRTKTSRCSRSSSRTVRRDLYLKLFTRIFKCNTIHFIFGNILQ